MKRPYREESLRWLTQAKDEFQDADDLRKRGRFYIALFHFQQAAEKAFKAYLYAKVKSVEVFYTHSIYDLSKMALEIDPDIPELWASTFGPAVVPRHLTALLGGVILGFGARWANGCTSGHGISGTLQLAVSGWLAAICFFIGGIAAAMLIFRVFGG